MHKIEVSPEDFSALVNQFCGASGWRESNGKGSLKLNQDDEDTCRKLLYGDIQFVEKVDTVE